ncbi:MULTISPECIES: alpha/beta hydrolase [unclassified Bradyrhizobium]|uniref:alpha/beta fold hydrolase n=1 Tax=unclassified Bradyrhizobium TaxID=2631580 RepID=UPI001FF6FEDD|nr:MULTISPECIES: alpha/beta hydrolase [unclassified Bradyrhizobium]MCK1295372.1 alpha/beta hydrolase [Bradyrhizobium sp. 30]MCK1309903.1 alpha/beta hydrolase [Bradyrhizobium sp. 45]MCK1434867.1 alpha/beta hydrolase [Bradyrhizobium sp. 15]MCK1610867.1 alpha/beta hydrolase [Bradyrhizobium sp. 163]MCK1762673.1 alpha/beta hydrolase [Bradyrhizobium sp. 136]
MASGLTHRRLALNGMSIFYREAGRAGAPVLLLPHGYPCSSFQFRRLMPALADRWRTIAFDWPGFGYSGTPDPSEFAYDFDAYADVLAGLADALGLGRYALWLHDYGSQIGLRHAIAHPERIAALIIQNGDIYEDVLGPKYATIKAWWADKTPARHRPLEEAVSEDGFRAEFVGEVTDDVAARVPPDLWKLHWPLMDTPVRRQVCVGLMEKLEENLGWFARYQAYLREHRPPTLVVWGPEDGYMPAESARAYRRDLPDVDLHLLDGAGHWLLETHFDEALPLVRAFLAGVHA